jgi:hypothetical protein
MAEYTAKVFNGAMKGIFYRLFRRNHSTYKLNEEGKQNHFKEVLAKGFGFIPTSR